MKKTGLTLTISVFCIINFIYDIKSWAGAGIQNIQKLLDTPDMPGVSMFSLGSGFRRNDKIGNIGVVLTN